MRYCTIRGKRIAFETVGKTMPKGYERISTKSKLHELASAVLGAQKHQAVWLHVAVCAVAHGKPPGQIGCSPGKWTVDHIDANSTNNSASNLRWCEFSENTSKGNKTRHEK